MVSNRIVKKQSIKTSTAGITKGEALRHHAKGKPGEIEVIPTKPHSTQTDLFLTYSPGVVEPCLEIEKNPHDAYGYTTKENLMAVISNDTAVSGLGDIGPLAGRPVMEGKGLLPKVFAGIDVFGIEMNEKDPGKFIQTAKAISPTLRGISLKDIKALECFKTETCSKNEPGISVMHDDQHGTATISGTRLINALEIVDKKIEDVEIVVDSVGTTSVSRAKLYAMLGAHKENIVMCNNKDIISTSRSGLSAAKWEFATDHPIKTLQEAVVGVDVFLGLFVADVLTKEMVRSTNTGPIVFALANPNPEISYADAMASWDSIIFVTGRSDYPSQINSVLGFPYTFHGILDTHAKAINEEMKRAAVYAIVGLAEEPVPDVVNATYKLKRTTFRHNYILPKTLDPCLLTHVSCTVTKAVIDSGVSCKMITDWEGYANRLREMMGYGDKLLRSSTDMAKASPERVVFTKTNHVNMLKAAAEVKTEGICFPILLDNEERLAKIATEENISLEGIGVVNFRHDRKTEHRHRYTRILSDRKACEGVTYSETCEKMVDRNAFDTMMMAIGDTDAFVAGVYSRYSEVTRMAEQIIGIRPGCKHFGVLSILTCKKGTFFMADTLINRHPSAEVLINITRLTHDTVKFFAHEPMVAMPPYSNFGSGKQGSPLKVHGAIDFLRRTYPDMVVDGEMQINFTLDKKLRGDMYPFNKLKGQGVNTLIFLNLSPINSTYKLLDTLGITETIDPIQMGLNKPVHFTDIEGPARDIVNLTTVVVVDAIVREQIEKGG